MWLAMAGGRVAGRIAAIEDRLHNEAHGERVAWFGFFEASDEAVAAALLSAVEAWGRARGASIVRGPASPSLNESAGLLVDRFDEDPYILMPHNPPQYAAFVERAGYRKVKDLLAWTIDLTVPLGERIQRVVERIKRRHDIVIRTVDMREFDRDLGIVKDIYRTAWQENWGFVAPTDREIRQLAVDLRPIIDPELVLFVEMGGKPVAYSVAIPDVNQVLKKMHGSLSRSGSCTSCAGARSSRKHGSCCSACSPSCAGSASTRCSSPRAIAAASHAAIAAASCRGRWRTTTISTPASRRPAGAATRPIASTTSRSTALTEPGRDLRIGFVGAGRVASGLGLALSRVGYPWSPWRAGRLAPPRRSRRACPARSPSHRRRTWPMRRRSCSSRPLTISIGPTASGVTWRSGQSVAHCSGAADVGVLARARDSGARIGGFHPLQNFADPDGAARELAGCTFAIEAEEPFAGVLEAIARSLGGVPLRLPPGVRALYHASASYAGPFIVRLLLESASLWSAFGVGPDDALRALLPLARGTLASVATAGSRAYIGGAVARGDVGTVRRHLDAMGRFAPHLRSSYAQLLLEIVPVAVQQGTLSPERADELTALLSEAL